MIDSPTFFDKFPAAMFATATVESGGVDVNGDPVVPGPGSTFRALFAPDGSTEGDAERSSETVTTGTLVAPLGEVPESISSTSRIRLSGAAVDGRYAVVGDPLRTPLGWQIRLRKEATS